MKFIFKKVLLLYVVIIWGNHAWAQESWPSPEVEQMYRHAQEYMAMGNFSDAIVTYKQAILLASEKMILYQSLGTAFYRLGKYSEAEQTLTPLLNKPEADATCYELLAASQAAQKEMKEAKATLRKGLERFPGSGLLYHQSGMMYSLEKKKEEALSAWLNGIAVEPAFAPNYDDAALMYLTADNDVEWGILYAEIYLCMAHDTTGDQLFKTKLFEGYKAMFDHIAGNTVPQYGNAKTIEQPNTFVGAVQYVYSYLTPVISDGITTENLTMARTRFLMDWFATWNIKYPFTLFSYQDELIRNGYFDMYNEWLFGKAESITEYDAWNKFHVGDMDRFITWKLLHPLVPIANDLYNDRNELFEKTKN